MTFKPDPANDHVRQGTCPWCRPGPDWAHGPLPFQPPHPAPYLIQQLLQLFWDPHLHVVWIPEWQKWAPHAAQSGWNDSCTSCTGHPDQTVLHTAQALGHTPHAVSTPMSLGPSLHITLPDTECSSRVLDWLKQAPHEGQSSWDGHRMECS